MAALDIERPTSTICILNYEGQAAHGLPTKIYKSSPLRSVSDRIEGARRNSHAETVNLRNRRKIITDSTFPPVGNLFIYFLLPAVLVRSS